MTDTFHKKIKLISVKEGVSLNEMVINALDSTYSISKKKGKLEDDGYRDLLSPTSRKIVKKALKN